MKAFRAVKGLARRVGKKLDARVAALRGAAGVGIAAMALGQTATDITSVITQLLPIIMSLFAMLIPLIFIMKIFDVIERVFRSFT